MTRRVACAALAYAAVGARAQVCEITIEVDGEGVGLAFADDAELDAAVRGFVARFELPVDQMGCAWIPLRSAHKAPTAARNAGGGESSAQEPSRAE